MLKTCLSFAFCLPLASPAFAQQQAVDPELRNNYVKPGTSHRWADPDLGDIAAHGAIEGAATLVADVLSLETVEGRADKFRAREERRSQAGADLRPIFAWNIASADIGPPDPVQMSAARSCAERVDIVTVDAVESAGGRQRVSGQARHGGGAHGFTCEVTDTGRITAVNISDR